MNPESPLPPSSIEKTTPRLLPLVEGAANEKLANLLATLLVEDAQQAEMGARAALMILTGIQAFYDSGGDARVIELAWRPTILCRELEKEHGENAWKAAARLAGEALAAEKTEEAEMYQRAALMLNSDINKGVDNPS